MEPKTVVTMLGDIKTTSLFVYNEKVKQMLYQCKGCFDYEMADIFLSRHRSFLRRKYKGWTLVPAPSYGSKDQVRGFNHVIEIFKGLERPFIHAIEKTDNVKQADLNFVENSQDIEIYYNIVSIVANPPNKTEYIEGQDLNLDGG
ncbi:MAG: hypothetical protein IKX82_03070, partial [Bacilli bacterium]|nr:hypothetical protein [Bacilli bacterium]